MFIGHFGLAFGAKRAAPAVSLGTLFLAAQLADLIWPALVMLGVEVVRVEPGATRLAPLDFVHYPYSHSLAALFVWGTALALVWRVVRRARGPAPFVISLLVVSHWVLDAIVHRPDLPLTVGGSRRYGLGLWNSAAATLAIELALFAGGVLLYARSTTPADRWGTIGLRSLAAFLAIVYAANLFGPPPPDTTAVAIAAQAMWLLVMWGYWVDRHRTYRA